MNLTGAARALRAHPLVADGLLALALTAIDLGWLVSEHVPGPGATVLVVLQSVPLVARRRFPVPVGLIVGAARVSFDALHYQNAPQPLGVLVALYTVANLVDGAWRRVTPVLAAAGLAVSMAANNPRDRAVQVALNVALLAGAWVLGDSARTRRAFAQEAQAAGALEERARIARELHDLVAHHLSVIAVQSQAAEALLPADPERARVSVSAVNATAREAMAEMRQLLGVLRAEAARSPQPGLADLDRLVSAVRDAGTDVVVEMSGEPRPLAPAVDLTCYRVVQEALTNALKHAPGTRVTVRLAWGADGLAVEVHDDGVTTPQPNDDGHGLRGMHERVTLVGGHVSAGWRPGAGFAVSAWVPAP
ncbi:MAG TPA: sensor histidine kinase [Acidimicrobiales bacterium]|nr:sensor histidine kinase [Acidimicrobiales bacterium]